MWNALALRRANVILEFSRPRQRYTVRNRSGYESRNAATIHLLVEALESCKARLANSFRVAVFSDDFVSKPPRALHFAYCTDGTQPGTIAIPDFLFWSWPQVGIADYERTVESMLAAGEREPDDSRLFWVGNPATHPTRAQFLEIAARDPRIRGIGTRWIHESASGGRRMQTVDDNHVTLEDHCRYRYLIDLQGRGYSARVKLLLFSGRPLFLQARRWKEFYYCDLEPMVHYVPVREDLSDLGQMLEWAEAHPDQARQIAHNARQYALSHLRRHHAIEVLASELLKIANGQEGSHSRPG
jgi:hypothetical protein